MNGFSGTGTSFDLTAVRRRSGYARDRGFWAVVGVTAWAFGAWAVIVLPLAFAPPRELCIGRGTCSYAPVSWFYPILALWTVFLVGLGIIGLWSTFRQVRPPMPSRVTVFADGFTIDYGPKRRNEARWSNTRELPVLWDGTGAVPYHPKAAVWPTPYLVDAPTYSFRVTEDAFNAILESGRSRGLRLKVLRGGVKHFPEEIGYEFGPP